MKKRAAVCKQKMQGSKPKVIFIAAINLSVLICAEGFFILYLFLVLVFLRIEPIKNIGNFFERR